jgi:diguanylate cyclase (GGDEF)-like protein
MIERVFITKGGRRINLEGVLRTRRDGEGNVIGARIIYHDVTERRIAESLLFKAQKDLEQALSREKELARIDFLTQLCNRRAFFELGEVELARLRRHQRAVTMAYIDLDNFKGINDKLGHETGDSLLLAVTQILKSNLRSTDVIARLGGDEFAVLLPETTAEVASALMQKLRGLLNAEMQKQRWAVTFCIGLVTHASPPPSFDRLIQEADELMYNAKRAGKDRVESASH